MEGATFLGGTQKNKKGIFTPFGILLFVLSVFYIGAEAIFNMKLVDVAGSVKSDPNAIKELQHFGRAVSGYGFSLLTLGAFESSGFRLRARRYWVMFGVLAAISFIPFLIKTQQTLLGAVDGGISTSLHAETYDTPLCVLPFLGISLVFLSAGRFRFHLILGLLLMAWPAMFLGQKLLIERYLVDRTSWQERQEARYMLMLRSGLEDCILQLGGLQFCDASQGESDMKAARIVVSNLWMLSASDVLASLKDSEDKVVENAAASGLWFSPQEQYTKYVNKVSDVRTGYLRSFSVKYYAPYKHASDMYMKAMDPVGVQKEADAAAAEVDDAIDAGWKKYQDGVYEFRQQMSSIAGATMRQALPYLGKMDQACNRSGGCPEIDFKAAIREAQERGETEFYQRSGYHSNIPDRATFVAQKKTQDQIRASVQDMVRTRYGMTDFTLPDNWTYDPPTFKEKVKSMISQQARDAWHQKFGDKLPPGMDEKRFLAALGVGDVPTTSDLIMGPDDFFKKVVVPGNRKIADAMLEDLKHDKGKYPAGAYNMEEGKDYIEALYIPTISLVISLTVVVLTLLRGFMAFMDIVLRSGGQEVEKHWHYVGRGTVAAFFIGMLLTLPHIMPNPYASGPAYERYYGYASDKHPFVAGVLNWAVQVQPIIYRLGRDIRRVTG